MPKYSISIVRRALYTWSSTFNPGDATFMKRETNLESGGIPPHIQQGDPFVSYFLIVACLLSYPQTLGRIQPFAVLESLF